MREAPKKDFVISYLFGDFFLNMFHKHDHDRNKVRHTPLTYFAPSSRTPPLMIMIESI